MNKTFSKNFLWGGAISACQAEGAYDVDGKSLTFPDIVKRISPEERENFGQAWITEKEINEGKMANISNYPKRWGIDFYHTYVEDIEMLAEMGFKTFRFSIAISRVFPNLSSEFPNEKALLYYDKVIDTCLKHNIEPLVTMSHFDPPISVWEDYGGWSNRELIDIYYKYFKVILDRYHSKVKYWLPFNEINAGIMAPFKALGIISGSGPKYETMRWQAEHNQFVCAAKTVIYGKKMYPELQFGCMVFYGTSYPYSPNPKDVLANQNFDRIINLICLDVQVKGEYPYFAYTHFDKIGAKVEVSNEDIEILKQGTADWIGYSYYQSVLTADNMDDKRLVGGNLSGGLKNEYLEANEWGWQIDPDGLRYITNQIYDRYRKPIFILENGIGKIEQLDGDNKVHDQYRSDYLVKHLQALKAAIQDGCEVLGYTWWSPIDIISSGTSEMSKRYGFIYVDQNEDGTGSKNRYKKDSFYTYKHIIETNGEDL